MGIPPAKAQVLSTRDVTLRATGSWTALYVLLLLAAINVFSYVDRAALSLVLPAVKKDLDLSDTALGLISGLPFALCYSVCSIPAAWLADRWSRRNLMSLGLAFWSAMTALSAAATSGLQLAGARLLLGAGESPGLPTSASLVADLFVGQRRAGAYAVLAASSNLGVLLGFPVVAWALHAFGWRAAFLVAGVPGLVLALVFYLTVSEPARRTTTGAISPSNATTSRGNATTSLSNATTSRSNTTSSNSAASSGGNGATPGSTATFKDTLSFLAGSRAYLFILLAGALVTVNVGSMLAWAPTFLTRVHRLTPGGIGMYFGTMRGTVGLLSAVSAGLLVNALAKRNELWRVWLPACAELLLFPVDALFLLAHSPQGWQVGLALDAALNAIIVATTYTLFVSVARARMRATSTAIYFIVCSLVGLAGGPALVGVLNDWLGVSYGDAVIRYSMLVAAFAAVGAGLATLVASRYWQQDLARTWE
jgi:MFS family permease